ncbi:MAG: carbamoyltransferase HypF [Prolixibacteraceae bacterium]
MNNHTIHITIRGLVQGVGFRPFVYRQATKLELNGWVQNTNESVVIRVTGNLRQITLFQQSLKDEAPAAAIIEDLHSAEIALEEFPDFRILVSHNISEEITEICPDIAVCEECMADIERDGNRRDYPFVNCTNCGPRFTIIRDLPYDRAKTTMAPFAMCPDCSREYEEISDRRFHAQPVACNICGPHYEMFVNGKSVGTDTIFILDHIAQLLHKGGVVAIKGLGGMHLACDAFDDSALQKLRKLKHRESKPFAVLFRDVESVKKYATVSEGEEQSLCSWRRPIVLLQTKGEMSDLVNSGLNLLGVMMPYLPFHHQLFARLKTDAIVLTSGNFSSEPILIGNEETLEQFSDCTDAIVLHNRAIYNRTDDSVVRIVLEKERVFRRSRGYVPAPVRMRQNVEGILAFGAELTNCFCVGKGEKAFLSQHIGDLKGLETTTFYEQTIAQFIRLFRIEPSLLVVDLHPDYISTRTAEQFAPLPVVAVQHHHAHIASCMAEHHLDEPVVGVSFDGTGYGSDGNIWGAEFFVCDLNDFSRHSHFEYVPLPGGDLANEEHWRMAVSYLKKVFGSEFLKMDLPPLRQVEEEKIEMLVRMIDQNVNCPLTSSAGRLFDAVASILGICQVATFSAQGPMLLEALSQADLFDNEKYAFHVGESINFDDTIRGIIEDLNNGVAPGRIAAKFHQTIISVIFETVETISINTGIQKVVLSGGVFQNKILLEGAETKLRENNFEVYSHASIPTNDGGIALGQMAIAAKRRELKCV